MPAPRIRHWMTAVCHKHPAQTHFRQYHEMCMPEIRPAGESLHCRFFSTFSGVVFPSDAPSPPHYSSCRGKPHLWGLRRQFAQVLASMVRPLLGFSIFKNGVSTKFVFIIMVYLRNGRIFRCSKIYCHGIGFLFNECRWWSRSLKIS